MPSVTHGSSRGRVRRGVLIALAAVPVLIASSAPILRNASAPKPTLTASSVQINVEQSAEVNFTDLAQKQGSVTFTDPPRPLIFPEFDDESGEPGATAQAQSSPSGDQVSAPKIGPDRLFAASPAPSKSYQGLDDIPMADSNYIIIPPDVAGGVGPTKVMESFNNNYRIRDKATGTTQLTLGTATFWAAVTTASERLSLTDPRTTYDPYNNRWIVCMQTVGLSGSVLVGVSQTSDPAGGWLLYKFTGLSGSLGTAYQLDFPILGFNKNWVAVTINRYTSAGAFSYGICLALDYPQLRAGLGSGLLFTLNSGGAATHFCTSPAVTYSATEDSLFLVTHLSSAGATYAVDVITGTPAAPVYNLAAASNVRPGGGWVQPNGNIMPQSAPVGGASACGATPCKIEAQDAQVRSSPVYRNGFLWYAQTIAATGSAHTMAQWTKITPSTTPAFADGGRLEDVTATATNGGVWYDHCSLSVNASNDMMLGFTQFSSAQHPSAGYAMRLGTDPAGTIRDAFLSKPGEDYYHKTFTSTTGRNRWGDFSTVQVDPCDDQTLWCLQEYAKSRTGIDDGNTGSNSSRWSSWWAAVSGIAPVADVTCPIDAFGTPGGILGRTFRVTNTGSAAGTFDYSVSDVAGWGGPVSGTTPVLAPAAFYDVNVNFNIPSNCSPPSDQVTFSATVTAAPGCNSAVTCNTQIYCDLATATLLSKFEARSMGAGVDLTWWSDAIDDISSWRAYRSPSTEGPWEAVNLTPIAMRSGGDFRLHDDQPFSGGTYYRLGAIMADGHEQMLGTTFIGGRATSLAFAVSGGNPFTNRTTLRYSLVKAEPVRLDIYSVTGERVTTLVNRVETAGEHSVQFSLHDGGRSLAPGVYLARLTVGAEQRTLRLIGRE